MKIMKNHRGTATEQNVTAPPVDESLLPVDPETKQPLQPMAQPGYYPGYSTLSQKAFWDEATCNVVLARVEQVPPVRFFSPQEAELMQAVCDRLLPQDDRDEAHKIPVLNYYEPLGGPGGHKQQTPGQEGSH